MTGAVTPPLPPGPFDWAYAHPGLFWRGWSSKGEGRSPQKHNRCEDAETIRRLPIAGIMAPNSVHAIWPYGPRLTDTLRIMLAWGFIFTSIGFVWVKVDKHGKPLMGLGKTTRKACEIVLRGTRGQGLPICDHGVLDVVFAPRLKPTGRKPDEVRHRLECRCGEVRRIELFARGEEPLGWSFFGDQAGADRGRHHDLSTAIQPMEAAK